MITNYDINPTNCKVDEKLVDSNALQACFQTTKNRFIQAAAASAIHSFTVAVTG